MTWQAPPNPALPELQASRGEVRPIRCVHCELLVAWVIGPPERREIRKRRPCHVDKGVVLWAVCEPACPAVGEDAA